MASAAIFVGSDPFRVAFAAYESGHEFPEVYLTDLASPPERVTDAADGSVQLRSFMPSKNGSTVVYRRVDTSDDTTTDLSYARTSDPDTQVRIALPGGAKPVQDVFGFDQFVVSDDGLWIALIGNGSLPADVPAVYLLNVNEPSVIYNVSAAVASYVETMRFSADSRQFYFLGSDAADGSHKSLYHVALDAPTTSELLSIDLSGAPPTDDVVDYSVARDGSRMLLLANRDDQRSIQYMEAANPRHEFRLSHALNPGETINGTTALSTGISDNATPRVAYTIDDASGPIGIYVADISSTPNPRQVVGAAARIAGYRPDENALLYSTSSSGMPQIFEAPIASASPPVSVMPGEEGFYDSAGNVVISYTFQFRDTSSHFYVLCATSRGAFGSSEQIGTPGMETRYFNVSGADRAIVLVGEGSAATTIPWTMRLAIINASAPHSAIYLSDIPIPVSLGRAVIVGP